MTIRHDLCTSKRVERPGVYLQSTEGPQSKAFDWDRLKAPIRFWAIELRQDDPLAFE